MTLSKTLKKDVSRRAVKRAVLTRSVQRPLTLYPAVLGVVGGLAAVLFDWNPLTLGVMGACTAITLGNWLWEYVIKGDEHARDFVAGYRRELAETRAETLAQLMEELRAIDDYRGLKQVELLRTKYENFVEILDRKFDSTELTYNRYMSIAEQVFLAGLDNLESAALARKSVSAIDEHYIQQQLTALQGEQASESQRQREELQQRLALKQHQLRRVDALMLENESALTQLDIVATKIASISTKQGRAMVDLEEAMNELRRLIARADNYAIQGDQ